MNARSIATAMLCLTGAAQAHSWYPWECCHGDHCAEIPASAVTEQGGGWRIVLDEATHPILKKMKGGRRAYFVPYRDVRASPDGRPHACILESNLGALRCAFLPLGGA